MRASATSVAKAAAEAYAKALRKADDPELTEEDVSALVAQVLADLAGTGEDEDDGRC